MARLNSPWEGDGPLFYGSCVAEFSNLFKKGRKRPIFFTQNPQKAIDDALNNSKGYFEKTAVLVIEDPSLFEFYKQPMSTTPYLTHSQNPHFLIDDENVYIVGSPTIENLQEIIELNKDDS
mgnify:CR=1 FL=1|tara:strand:+ start:1353 stop:1715 length:363 start_codon:yes stop_codon:yes gene_type:complete